MVSIHMSSLKNFIVFCFLLNYCHFQGLKTRNPSHSLGSNCCFFLGFSSRIHYNQYMVGKYLCDFLDSGKVCSECLQWCFSCIYSIWANDPNDLATNVISNREEYVPLEMYFCSQLCADSGLGV